jgi:alkane 1-monooxygenase
MTSPAAITPWRDRKRYGWLLGAVLAGLPLYGYLLVQATGSTLGWWFTVLFVYGFLPLMDFLVGTDTANPPDAAVAELARQRYYRWAVYVAVPVVYAVLVFAAFVAVRGGLRWPEWLGWMMSTGIVSGVSINLAHELGHQSAPFERLLAKVALAPSAYGHFFVEHNRGHHVRVATFEDPASARFGESFYRFYPRCVIGGVRSAIELERRRLRDLGRPFWHPLNELLQAWTMTVALYGALTLWLGWAVLPFLLAQAIYGSSLLELVNYVEHYGLCRQRQADGRYERCQPRHSWNSNHLVSNLTLYQLQRHSDHHAHATRSYQALRHFDDAPQLPSGYMGMILLAYVPPLWFRVMDPRVRAHYGGDLRLANLVPAPRAQRG